MVRELGRFGKEIKTDNIFNLINKFSNNEDELSSAFGFMLSHNPKFLQAFLKNLGISKPIASMNKFIISTQKRIYNPDGVIDICIKQPGELKIYIEAKVRDNKLEKKQLRKYAENLTSFHYNKEYKEVRLVAITLTHQKDLFKSITKELPFKSVKYSYFRWKDMKELWINYKGNSKIDSMFKTWLGDRMEDKMMISDYSVGEIPEVMIVSVKPEDLSNSIIGKKQYTCQSSFSRKDCQYIGFYVGKPESGITHIAKVIKTHIAPITKAKETPHWGDIPHEDVIKIYDLEKPVKLPQKIPYTPKANPRIKQLYISFSDLMASKDMADIIKFAKKRK